MRLMAVFGVPQSLLRLILLAALLAFPVNAQAETDPAPKAESPHASQSAKAETQLEEKEDSSAAGEQAKSDPASGKKAESKAATEPAGSEIVVTIDKGAQAMTVWVDGMEQHNWPVSTGMSGYSTPSGTYTVSSMNKIWYSKQWDNAPMPHSIFFTKKGHAIHGSHETKRLGTAASHGCVRLSPKNAATLFTLVKTNGMKNVKVVISGTTPGGESVVASPSRPKVRRPGPDYRNPWFDPRYAERPRRRGRWFQRRQYSGPDSYPPQGYYRQYPPQGYYRQRRGLFFRRY